MATLKELEDLLDKKLANMPERTWRYVLDDPRTAELDGTTAERWLAYANIKAGNAGSIDTAALVDALRADVVAAVKEGVAQGQTPEVVADAVVKRFGSKLAEADQAVTP